MGLPSPLYVLLVSSLLYTSVESGCQDIALTLKNRVRFPDHFFTATSHYDNRYVAKNARFDSPKGWGVRSNGNANDYLEIDLGRMYKICAVATRAARSASEWVTRYKLHFSQDNINWDVYKENNAVKVFTGNSDLSSAVKNDVLVKARFVRLQPTAFRGHKSVRVEIYGKPEDCSRSLEIGNRGIENAQMTSSSSLDNAHAASRGRLYGDNSWCSSTSSSNEYLQVDLGRVRRVTGIATQGDQTADKWVETYTISHSQDGSIWSNYADDQSSRIVLSGNRNRNNVRFNIFKKKISARYFRVYARTWNTAICMRIELYGCLDERFGDNNPLGLESGAIQDSQLSASSNYNNTHPASNARLHYTGGPSWCASISDLDPYLQIDLGSSHVICAVATQGDHHGDQWTTFYTLQGSLDGTLFEDYTEGNAKRIFKGNFDQNTVVKLSLNEGLVARYVRLLPVSVNHGAYCIRAEIYGMTPSVCQHSAVGIRASSNVPDYRMTATTHYSAGYLSSYGRLYGTASWATKRNNENDYLQIDLGALYVLCALATQGSPRIREWTKTYNVSLSVDGVTWNIYEENDAQKVFNGNTDGNTVVRQTINPTAAKFIRFYPKTFNTHRQLRVEVYGLKKECRSPLGVESFMGIDPVAQLYASSQLDAAHSAVNGRLYGNSAWCTSSTVNQYIQVDLLVSMSVTGVVTQGDADLTTMRWVRTFDVQIGYSTSRWLLLKGIQGNENSNTAVTHWFSKLMGARYVRILPRTWSTSICLRMDVYGCKQVAPPDIETVRVLTNLTASMGSSAQLSCSIYALPNIRVTWKQGQTNVTSSSQISYIDGFANSILRVSFTNADDYEECAGQDQATGTAVCSRMYTCEGFYDNTMNGPADSKDGKVFVELAVPSAPTRFTIGSILDTSASLTWLETPPTVRQATVKLYKVEYHVDGGQTVFQDTTGGDSRSHVIGGLLSNTSYVVTLRALSQVGVGASAIQRFRTLPTILCKNRAIGMELGSIPDPYITASSQMNSSTRPSNARLHYTSGSSWCAAAGDSDPYLQIDLGSSHLICAVATQGNRMAEQWVTSYSLLFSDDGINWMYFLKQERRKVFQGNTDRNSVSKHVLESRLTGRFIRFIPRGYHEHSCLRIELYGRPVQKECADISVGLSSANTILDHRFTASSRYGDGYKPSMARFGSSAGWAPSGNSNPNDYLQIDLGAVHRICAVATYGSAKGNEYVTRYKLFLSMDDMMWTVYKDNGGEKIFPGNVDWNVMVKNQLTEAVSAKFIRFYPTAYIGFKTMRAEVYGVPQDCTEPLGIENRGVEDAQMTPSSNLDNNHDSSRGRLYGSNSWCSSTASSNEYLQVDLGDIKTVSGIATQGDSSVQKWIKTFALSSSMNGKDWITYTAGKTLTKVLNGNSDRSTVAVNWLPYPFNARYVRVIPLTWNAGPCLRFDVYGCSVSCANLAVGLQQGQILDSQINASSVYNISTVAWNARLHYTSGSSWCAAAGDSDPYLQIDLGSSHVICAVATQGDHLSDSLVETYQIQGSSDGTTFTDYEENNALKIFQGNYDRISVIKQMLKTLFVARYVRFFPKSYNVLACMRVEVYGSRTTSGCVAQPVGLRVGSNIRDHRLDASSVYSVDYPISSARLYAPKAWATRTTVDNDDFVQVDLGSVYAVCGVATQGSPATNEWTKSYKMETSLDRKTWSFYSERGSTRIFIGNTDRSTVVKRDLANVVAARFVRIYPVTYHAHKDLRFELYGIKHSWALPLGLETGSIGDTQLTATSSYNSSHVAEHARLYGVLSWCKSISSTSETYLQVDFRTVIQIAGIATQGNDENAWVTSYDLGFSYSTSNWQYRSNIQGNVDSNGLVIHMFNQSLSARYLRLRPQTAHVVSCVRMEVYGNKFIAKPEISNFAGNKSISASKGSWVEYQCRVKAQEFVTILWKHGNRILPGKSVYAAEITVSTLTLNYTNGDDFAVICHQVNLSSQVSNCSSTVTCQAFYDYLLTDGSAKKGGTVYTEIKVPLAPVNITFVKIRHHSAQVHWTPGQVTLDRASVRYFHLQYYPVNDASRVLNMTVGASKRMAHIGGLDANTSYVVRIRAVSVAGEGIWATEYFTSIRQMSCSKKALGMEDKTVPDVYVTSSSKRDNSTKASFGRLNRLLSWCASASDPSPFLQIDLGTLYVICAAATQGNPGNDEWVTSYVMQYTRDAINWRPVLEKSEIKIFLGNQDRSTVVIREVTGQPVARSVRFVPKTSNGSVCLRTELYGEVYHLGCADVPIGVDSPSNFPDHRFTASSYFSINHQPSKARLGGDSSWRPRTDANPDDYLQIDLGTIYTICVIETDGQSPTDRIVSYVLYYSLDNKDWDVLVDPRGMIKVVNDSKTRLENRISARFVRLYPREYAGHKSLRVQLYGVAEVCKESLGLENKGIENNQMTSTSHLDSTHTASRGRLYGDSSWCSNTSSLADYIEIDLGKMKRVRGIATQGDDVTDKWVKSYSLGYSIDGLGYKEYTGGTNTTKVFVGNTDRDSVEVNWFRYPVNARYIKISPHEWNTAACLRVDLYGGQASCSNTPLGLESGAIQDSQLSASSNYNNTHPASNARLHYTGGPSWCASTSDLDPYLQIDLGSPHVICAVTTQGDHHGDQWVEKYRVMGSLDETSWENEMELIGNSDRNTQVKHDITVAMTTRFVRFLPTRSYGNACMRVELYGTTSGECSKEPIGVRWGGTIKDHRMTSSSNQGPGFLPYMGRLHGPGGWSPRTTTNDSDFLQIDLGSVYLVCSVATQGGGERSQWTTSYILATSLDGLTWVTVKENSTDKVFPGNTDSSRLVKNTLNESTFAKFLRLYPRTYHVYKTLRVEVYGIQDGCRQSLGIENGRIQESQLSAWSSLKTNLSYATNARLYSHLAWNGGNALGSYLQVDLVDARMVTGIATQGSSLHDSWVDSYHVKFGFSTRFWYQMNKFEGNKDNHGVRVNWLAPPLGAVFVRIIPAHWKSTPYLRVDLYGCQRVASPRVLTVSKDANLTAINGSSVTLTCTIYGEPFTSIRWRYSTNDVTWSSTPPSHQEGRIRGNITISYTSTDMVYSTYECQRVNLSRTIRCWTPYTCYAYYTQYCNEGFDERSTMVFINLTLPASPILWTSNMNSTSVTINWNEPDSGDGSILSYKIKYGEYGSNTTKIVNSTSTGNTTQSIRLTGLDSYTRYTMTVIPVGSIGDGMESTPTVFVTYLRTSIYLPSSQYIFRAGQVNVTLQCYGRGFPLPNVTWGKDGLPVSLNHNTEYKLSQTNISSQLILGNDSGVTYQEAGNYTCHVVNQVDGLGPVSSVIEVIFKPEVNVTPSQIFSVEGKTVLFHCTTLGVPLPVISWNYNGGQLPSNTQMINNSLMIKNIVNTVANEGTYTCVATSRAGATESSANLTVWVLPRILPPLKNTTLMVGSTLNLTCAASGEPLPGVTWTKDNTTNFTAAEYSDKRRKLVIRSVTVFDEGIYMCNASSKAGWTVSRSFVTIRAAEEVFLTQPYTRSYTKNQTDITADCYGRGYPKPTIAWLRDNKTIPRIEYLTSNSTGLVVQVIQYNIKEPLGNVSSRLYLRPAGVMYADAGNYTCRVSNEVGTAPAEKTLQILFAPEFTVLPQDQIVLDGSHVLFTCAASGVPTPHISWLFNGKPTSHNVTNGNLFLTAIYNNVSYQGNYTCMARSRAGEDRRTVELYVDELPKVSRIAGPSQVELTMNLTLTCVVTGDPIPFVYWTRDGSRDIPDAVSSNMNRTLSIVGAQLAVEGVYRCVAWNRAGNDSMDFNVSALVYPMVHVAPPYLRAYRLGQANISIVCKGSGYPTPTVRWKKGDDFIPFVDFQSVNDTNRVVQVAEGNISSPLHNVTSVLYLRTRGMMYSDAGNYTCEVVHSSRTDPAQTVEVLFKPEFVFTSTNKIVLSGSDVIFFCLASGVPEPSVGWLFNNGNVSVPHWTTGSNITLFDVKNSDLYEGNYTCVTTSRAGTDRHTVLLQVDVPSMVLNITGNTSITMNTAINLTCAVEGDPLPSVFWVKDGSQNISSALYHHDNRSLVIRHAQIKDEGKYQCLAENRAGKDNKTVEISVLASPRIYTSHPSPTVFRRGSVNQTMDCYGNGYPKPSISWLRSNTIIPSVLDVTANDTHRVVQVVKGDILTPLQNVTSRLYLKTSGLTYEEAGNYSCQVSNKVATALRILEILFFPIIDVNPSDQRVLEGTNITFICQASGVPHPSVTWLYYGQAIPWNHTVVNGSLMLSNVRNKVHEGNYTCMAKSRAGQTNSSAQLVIDVPPQIREVSGNRTYLINTKILLTCNVTGDPVPSVSWMRPGAKPISFNGTLIIEEAGLADEGEYLCVAVSRAGNTSYRVFITIQALVSLYISRPIRRDFLQGDQNVTIDCQANGYPKPSVNWWFNGQPVSRVDDVYPTHKSQVIQVTWDNIAEKLENVTSRLFVRVDGIKLSDAGNYTCNASNGVGDGPRLQTAEILFRPEIQQAPLNKTVLQDTNVTFFCNVTGVPDPFITWTFSEGKVRSTDVTSNSLFVPYIQNDDMYEGVYTCNASNAVGTASASASLTIHTMPKITIPLPATLIIERGTTANLTCQSRADPQPKYRWYKARRPITRDYRLMDGNKTLLLSNVTVKDEGRYTCEGYNIEGSATTATNITVHAVPVLLQSLPLVSGIIENNTLQLSCRAESIPPPNVTWLLNGSLLTNDSSGHLIIRTSGILLKTSTLTITHVQFADQGTYQCVFTNYRGVANTSSTLEVYIPPRIITPLTNRTYPKGSTLTMTCEVTGEPYPSVHWFKLGSRDIPRAQLSNRNTTLVINDVRFEDRGEYRCAAVNKGGNDSSTATVIITVPTSVEIRKPFTRVYRRGMTNINVTCYAIGFPKPTLEWRRYGVRIPVVLNITEGIRYDMVQVIKDDVSGVQNLMKIYSVLYLRQSGIRYDEAGNYTCVANRSIDLIQAQRTIEVLFLPEFDVTPPTQIVTVGSNVTFSCNASGVPSPVISWFFNNKSLNAPNIGRNTLMVFLVQNTDAYEGQYTCSATSRAGTSNYTASLTVDVVPVIIDVSGNTTVLSGTKFNLTCIVRGDPLPRVLWIKDGSTISARANISKDTYTLMIEKAVFKDRGFYQCIAINRAGNYSRQVRMTVLVPPTVYVQTPLPRIFKQNQPNVYIDCYGNGYPHPSISWSTNNTGIPIIPSMTSDYSRSTVQVVNQNISHPMDNVTSRLYLRKEGLTLKEAGNYSCSAVNGIGVTSIESVEVLFFPEFDVTPAKKVVLERSTALFKCAVSGVPDPVVTWYFSGGSLPSPHSLQGSNLLIPDVKNNPSYEGNYTCVGRSRAGTANYTAQLVVHVSPVMVISLNQTLVVERGVWVTLFCKAAGDPEPAYLWIRDDVTLTATNHVRYHNNSQILVLTNVTTKDNAVYKCVAYNVEGNVSTSTNLTVHATVSLIQGLPSRTEILESKTLTLTCKADAIPLPSVTWYRNGQEIQDDNERWKILWNSVDSILTSTISLQNVRYDDRGDFSCAFSNYRGQTSSTGRVVVQVPPAIFLPPSSVSRILNKSIILNCSVRGYPEPTIMWSKDGVSVSQSDRISISLIRKNASIELTSYLSLAHTLRQDTGVYVCNASNLVGEDARTTSLTILEKPDRPVLSVVSLTATTALLQWNSTFNGNSPIRCYTISYNSTEGAYSINFTADLPKEHTFKGLLPATQYIFLVTARNDIGTSLGRESLGTTLESVPWQPRNVHAQSLSSTSVYVNWTTPTRTNGILTRYVVFIRTVNQTDEVNVTVGPSVTHTAIHGLLPYTYYEGEAQAYTKIGGGNRSRSFDAVLTFEDLPSAPRRLQATQSTSTSITLIWTRPDNMNGILRAYRITVRKDNVTTMLNVTQDSDDTVTYTVTGLRPYTVYNITVFAVTINIGNASNTIVYSTDEDKPGEPRAILSKFNGEMYEVSWLPPLSPNGVIIEYKVLFQLDRPYDDAKDKQFVVEGGRIVVEVMLTDLNGDKTYHIRVQARTSQGYGKISTSYDTIKTPITNPPEPETPSQSPDITPSTATINIPKFSDINGEIKFYGVINVVVPKGTQDELKDPASYQEEDLVSYCVAHQSKTPAAYLAFRFDASAYDKYKVFVLGKGQGTKCSMRVARASDTPTYYNGPLMPDTEYKCFSRGYTEKTFSQSGYIGFTTHQKPSGTDGGGGGGGGGTAAAIIVVVVILMVVVVALALYFYRRKVRNTASEEEEEERELNEMGKQQEDPIYDNVGAEAHEQRLPIPVKDLKTHYLRMHADSDQLFDEEYKSIESPSGVTTTKCDLPINKPKNRYGNIKAYDHSRVVLSTIDNEPGADYINANYIDGYSAKNKYIATIGPKESTCSDFWRMVWEQKSSIIVMLTKPEESGKVKCHQYWPEESETFDRVTVQLEEKEELADFEIRTFSLQLLAQPQIKPRKVVHFFFTSWPDHDVPDYATGLLEFWKRVKKYQSSCEEKGPMIVHCSAGVGRTGTFIVIDAMMEQVEAEGELDVYGYVTKIRSQRNYMVQRLSQYAFIHYALLEAVTFGQTEIEVQDLRTELGKLEERRIQTEYTGMEKQFELLNGVLPDDTYDFVTGVRPHNAKKNRFSHVLPFDRTRVVLSAVPSKEDSTYINASFLEGYQEKNGYIATQAPLVNTVTDFWRMVWETEVYCIVMLCTLEEPTKVPYVKYWPNKDSVTYGTLLIETRSQQAEKDWVIREFNVTNTQTGEVRKILHFNYLDWPENRQPTNLLSVIDLIGAIQKARRQHAHHPIVVHCSNGIGRTGAFCTLFTSLEKVKLEGYLDVFITARMLRTQRPGMVKTLEEYRMCYKAILAYLNSFEESQYQNFV